MAMKSWVAAGILASSIVLTWPLAHAQAPPARDDAIEMPRLNLTLEQKHVIKEVIKDMKVEPAPTSARSIGDAIASDTAPQPMPSDIGRKVPQVRTHTFVYTADRILIVDPKDNKVAEVVELN
jgi:hypothetical protein